MKAAANLDWAAMLPQQVTQNENMGASEPPAPAPLSESQTDTTNIVRSDGLIWCSDCQRLAGGKRCKAPAAGLLIASMVYEPVQTMPRRCFAYLPGPNDPDQSPGAFRWPWLIER